MSTEDSLSKIITTQEQADKFIKELKELSEPEENWDEIFQDIPYPENLHYHSPESMHPVMKWLKENFEPPKRKK